MPPDLPKKFPFRDVLTAFVEEYRSCTTYWYVPKVRVLNDENVLAMQAILRVVFDEFLDQPWNPQTQDAILDRLRDLRVVKPYITGATLQDRTALIRIFKKLLEMMGFVWVQNDQQILLSDAALDLLAADEDLDALRPVVARQVAKLQYPAPWLDTPYRPDFRGIVPEIFLFQVLGGVGWRITFDEYELFVNLAQGHDDLDRIVRYITHWRNLSDGQRAALKGIVEAIPMAASPSPQATLSGPAFETEPEEGPRQRRIHLNGSYQRACFTFGGLLTAESSQIACTDPERGQAVLEEQLRGLKVPEFRTLGDWFIYMGNPAEEPSWFTFLQNALVAPEPLRVEPLIEEGRQHLTPEQEQEIKQRQRERLIEDYFSSNLDEIEKGLRLVKDGRQYVTPIGRIDLLCQADDGQYVVVEVKVGDAEDAVFGQILRYIGWIHGNTSKKGPVSVRGIILAGNFPEKARYSRMGMLKADSESFIRFKKHGLALENA